MSLYAIYFFLVYLNFDHDPSYEFRCGIFHLQSHIGVQKASDVGVFQIWGFGLGLLGLWQLLTACLIRAVVSSKLVILEARCFLNSISFE